jgi:hypothetical protein
MDGWMDGWMLALKEDPDLREDVEIMEYKGGSKYL